LAAALEYVYHMNRETGIQLDLITGRYCVSRRLCAVFVRRLSALETTPSKF